MIDRREQILVAIKEALEEIDHPAAANVFRDRAEEDEIERPAFVLLDGVENAVAQSIDSQRKSRARTSSTRLRLRPQIWGLLKLRPPSEAHLIGPELSELRMQVLKAILTSTDLATLTGPNGDIAFVGHATDMQTGSSMVGTIQFFFEFDYWLSPDHLTT